jgi:arylsulfatase A-like enzyme
MDIWHRERVNSQRTLLGVDDSIQVLMDALKARGLLDSTMILYLGDHGFSWGSHRWYKKECVYEECIKFPLLIRYPGLAASREESRLVSNVDLASTIAEFAGVTPGLPQNGRSLVPLINNTAADWQEAVFMELHSSNIRTFDGIRVPGWTYAEYANGDKELYDLTADPFELQNLADDPAYQDVQARLARQMRDLKNAPPTSTP